MYFNNETRFRISGVNELHFYFMSKLRSGKEFKWTMHTTLSPPLKKILT